MSKQGAKTGWFVKFPKDVIKSEELTGGDPKILEKDPYVERNEPRVRYDEIFGTPGSDKKKKKKQDEVTSRGNGTTSGRKRSAATTASPKSKRSRAAPIVHPRFRAGGGGSDHQVKILPQPSAPLDLDLQMKQEKTVPSNAYTCHVCGFSATRLNVIVLHQKSHSEPSKTAPRSSQSRSPVVRKKPELTPKKTPAKPKPKPEKTPKPKQEPTPKRSAASKAQPVSKPEATPSKRKRMTKKQKIEQEKKKEERKTILDEWGDEEEDEAEERKKINESMGKTSDMSDDDSDRDAFLGDDNIHGYDDDDDDDDENDDKKEEAIEKADPVVEKVDAEKTVEKPSEELKSPEAPVEADELDIGKILEETKVPELPDSVDTKKKSKRGVKFSEELTKELQQKKIPLMQPTSNLEIPEEVDDEFAAAEEPVRPTTARPILKHISSPQAEAKSDGQKVNDVLFISHFQWIQKEIRVPSVL